MYTLNNLNSSPASTNEASDPAYAWTSGVPQEAIVRLTQYIPIICIYKYILK